MNIDQAQSIYDNTLPEENKDSYLECEYCKLWYPRLFMKTDNRCECCKEELPIED